MKMSEYFNHQRSHWTLSQSRKYSTTQLTEQWWTNSSCTITQRHFFEWISHIQSQINYRYHWNGGIITSICTFTYCIWIISKIGFVLKHTRLKSIRLKIHTYINTSYIYTLVSLHTRIIIRRILVLWSFYTSS